MIELERLGKTGSPLARELLRAGREEAPAPRVSERTLKALGMVASGAAVLTAAAPLSAAAAGTVGSTAGGGVGLAVIAKWLGVGMVVGLTGAGTVGGIHRAVNRAQTIAARAAASAAILPAQDRSSVAPPAPSTSRVSSLDPTPPRSAPRSARALPDTPVPMPVDAPITREVAILDRARSALQRGDTASAGRELDRHQSDHPEGSLRAEALYLRMEVLAKTGERSRAAGVARELLRTYPESAQSARAREVAGPAIP